MRVSILDAWQDWGCPNCWVTDRTRPHPPNATRFHACPGLHGLTAPMIRDGSDCVVIAVERGDYLNGSEQRTGDDGKPYMSVMVKRADGSNDLAVFPEVATTHARRLVQMLLSAVAEVGVNGTVAYWALTPPSNWTDGPHHVNNTAVHRLEVTTDTPAALLSIRYGRGEITAQHGSDGGSFPVPFDSYSSPGLADPSHFSQISANHETVGIHEVIGAVYSKASYTVKFDEPVTSHPGVSGGGSADSAFSIELKRLDTSGTVTCRIVIWFEEA